jgi:predicted lipoprotein with Yx(FWY)xxD motif
VPGIDPVSDWEMRVVSSVSKRLLAVPAVGILMVVAACGSSSPSGNTGGGPAAGGSKGATMVVTHSGQFGTYLTDGKGRSLYLFASDSPGKSTCSGPCLTYWPPLTTTAAPTAGGSANSSMLGTISMSSGAKQVTYAGHPLYYYAGDAKAGDTNGQGNDKFGAKWWLVSATGRSITSAAGGSPSYSPTTSSGGGGDAWG